MVHLGQFKKTSRKVFTDALRDCDFCMPLRIVKCFKFSRKAPDYRVYSGKVEIGAGCVNRSAKGREYLALRIHTPASQHPWRAALLHAHDEIFDLIVDPQPWTPR